MTKKLRVNWIAAATLVCPTSGLTLPINHTSHEIDLRPTQRQDRFLPLTAVKPDQDKGRNVGSTFRGQSRRTDQRGRLAPRQPPLFRWRRFGKVDCDLTSDPVSAMRQV